MGNLEADMSPAQSEPAAYNCSVPVTGLDNPEQRQKHERSHKKKSFSCSKCDKSFSRRDILQRHKRIHDRTPLPRILENGHVLGARKACTACAMHKVRCSGGQVCMRCQKQNLRCEYPARKNRAARTGAGRGAMRAGHEASKFTLPTSISGPSVTSAVSSTTPIRDGRIDPVLEETIRELHSPPTLFDDWTYLPGIDPSIYSTPSEDRRMQHEGMYIGESLDRLEPTGIDDTLQYGFRNGPHSRLPGISRNSVERSHRLSTIHSRSSSQASNSGDESCPSNAPSESSAAEPGSYDLYVNSDHTRKPSTDRSGNLSSKLFLLKQSESQCAQCKVPRIVPHIEIQTHESLKSMYSVLCLNNQSIFKPLQSSPFPPVEDLSLAMQLFFHYFHPILPIIHRSSFNANQCHWLLVLAIVAVGSHYVGSTKTNLHRFPIGEYLRRALVYELERGGMDCQSRTWLIQSMILSEAHSLTSGERSTGSGVGWVHSHLADLFSPGEPLACFFQPRASCERNGATWADWISMETVRRVGYAIMLLDCIIAYQSANRPLLFLPDVQMQLPCDEAVWEASDLNKWQRICNIHDRISMQYAVTRLYTERKIENLGEFSSVLVLHAVLEETWSVQRYFQRPLSSWVPSSQRPAPAARPPSREKPYTADAETSSQRRALRIPLFSKWRDAACDCFDTLHWEANSICAKNAGIEHPAVLHLHLARIIILVPYAQIRVLADYIAAHGTCASSVPDAVRVAEREIYAWLIHDQFRARLAVVHAGALLWHIRRYSRGAFYEPPALFLASLTLWAYGTYAAHVIEHNRPADNGDPLFLGQNRASNAIHSPSLFPALGPYPRTQPPILRTTISAEEQGPRDQAMEAVQSPACTPQNSLTSHRPENTGEAAQGAPHAFSPYRAPDTAIVLDRPIDDEMVQFWVAEGIPQKITAIMFGSVDICALPHGPTRVLAEGRRLLQAPVMCRNADGYALILEKMVVFMKPQ